MGKPFKNPIICPLQERRKTEQGVVGEGEGSKLPPSCSIMHSMIHARVASAAALNKRIANLLLSVFVFILSSTFTP